MSTTPTSNFAEPFQLIVGNKLPGAPTLHLSLSFAERASRLPSSVSGLGVITQAVTPPGGRIPVRDIHGQLYPLGGPVELPENVIVLDGLCVVTDPPSQVVLEEPFRAVLLLGPEMTGHATFIYGHRVINNVPVTRD
ncbi:DUF1842 domain-containing protein [Roseateles chitinivorans]|uniref:DUF1842 domain-containing protein n=1 Tax=Roseateles chitinivorans TaxID=2917965 RepID=UPI003D66F480